MRNYPVLDAIKARRSIRRFTPEPVTDGEVLAMLEAARWAPSGQNNQPWRFLVVRADDPRQEVLAGLTKYGAIIRSARVLVCVFLAKERCYSPAKDQQGAGACLQNMLLAAHSLGLGAVWLGEIINQEPQVTTALGLDPARLQLAAVVAVGRPGQKGAAAREALDDLMLEPFGGDNAG